MSQQQAINKTDWVTPQATVESLGPFDLDPCAGVNMPWSTAHEMASGDSELSDGLRIKWQCTVWLNPPYGRGIDDWLSTLCYEPVTGIALVPANTDAKWFHQYAWRADAILWRKGRISFCDRQGNPISGNTKGSVFLAYGWDMVGRLAANVDNPAVGNGGFLQILGR